jgi:hypothetical protein
MRVPPVREVSGMEWTPDDDRLLAEAVRRHDAGEDLCARPGETTVPEWAMVAILLGLVALTGSLFTIVVVAAFGSVWWLLRTADTDAPRDQDAGREAHGPFGGPGIWL